MVSFNLYYMAPRRNIMRRIIEGTAYDTETAELVKRVWWDDMEQETTILYRTRHGAFFFYQRYLTPNDDMKEEIDPCIDERAQKWLEKYGNELVEQYFGEMPEGGSAERRLTLRMPNNLAKRLEEIAKTKATPLNRYINRCLERCAAEDGQSTTVV
jgi:predicted HicB family RNase H-like nuclease